MRDDHADIAVLGGGLAGGLIALAFAQRRPEVRVLLFEAGERFGGNHVWSFFEHDVAAAEAPLVEPLIAARWDGYEVAFPGYRRQLHSGYRSATDRTLDAALRAALPAEALLTGASVTEAGPGHVALADGSTIRAGAVIDARGAAGLPHLAGGWQVFLGRMLRLTEPHGLEAPVVMDARVAQHGAYRFVYCLPFSATTVLVEDTYYADDPALDPAMLGLRIEAYCESRGWQVDAVLSEETGVLPVVAGGDFEEFWRAGDRGIARAGVRAGLFHPLTSYSLPDAVRFAAMLVALPDISGAALMQASYDHARRHWRRGSFYRMLARMLFAAARPEQRWRVLERFYRLPEPLIERFYAGQSTLGDRARILAGRPPVPVPSALAALAGRGHPLAPLG